LAALVIACVGLADACLALDAVTQAQAHADEARRVAAGLSPDYDTQYLGASLRVSGDVLLALGEHDAAEAALAKSVEILSTGSEIARDELALAQHSLARAREYADVYGTGR
jgi:predicted negative regulator of RcsB-dependent stress response